MARSEHQTQDSTLGTVIGQVRIQTGKFPPILRRNKAGKVVIVSDYSMAGGKAVGGTQTDVTHEFVNLCLEYEREVKAMMIRKEMEDAERAVGDD